MRARIEPGYFIHDNYFINQEDKEPYPFQDAAFREFYQGYTSPTGEHIKYKEIHVAGGMGGGKTKLTSFFLCYDTFDLLIRENPSKDYGLASHAKIFVLCVAKSDEQAADTIFQEVKTSVGNSAFFNEYNPKIREYNITFGNHPDVEIYACGAASAGSAVGRNVKIVGFDEIDSYDETQSQRGAWQVYSRLRKSTNRFGFDGHVIAISSPWYINSIIMQLARKTKEDDPHSLNFIKPTWEMNPTKSLDTPEMQAELSKDPLTFWRDYGVQPHSSITSYYLDSNIVIINSERVNVLEPTGNNILDVGRIKLLDQKYTYILSIDPGLVNDCFGVALLHREGKKVIADGLWRFIPQSKERAINPLEIKQYLLHLLKNIPIRFLITDQWYYTEAIDEIQRRGVSVLFKPLTKEEHDAVRNAWFEKELELCNYPRIRDEFENLIEMDSRRIGVVRGGKIDVVDALTRGYWGIKEQMDVMMYPNVIRII